MRKKIKICKRTFDILHESIHDKYRQDCLVQGKVVPKELTKFYGFHKKQSGENTTEHYSLIDSIVFDRDQKCQAAEQQEQPLVTYTEEERFSIPSPKNLYNLYLSFKSIVDPYETLEVNADIFNIYVKYLDYNTFAIFLEKHNSIEDRLRNIQTTVLYLKDGDFSKLAHRFTAYYYSYIDQTPKRKQFSMTIDFANKSKGKYPVKLVGLHTTPQNDSDDTVYLGTAEEKLSCLYINLMEEINNRPLNMMAYKSHIPPKDMDYFLCSLIGISKMGVPVAIEVIMQKERSEDSSASTASPKLSEQSIDYYLQMRRNNFRIPSSILNHQSPVIVGTTSAQNLINLPGTYRIWSFRWQGQIVQSKLHIGNDFIADLQTISKIADEQVQTCLMSVSSVRGKKLCVASHSSPSRYDNVVNYAILDLDLEGRQKVLKGVFCGNGASDEPALVSEYMVLTKDQDLPFEAKTLGVEEVKTLIHHPHFGQHYKRLLDKLFAIYGLPKASGKFRGRESLLRKVEQFHWRLEAMLREE